MFDWYSDPCSEGMGKSGCKGEGKEVGKSLAAASERAHSKKEGEEGVVGGWKGEGGREGQEGQVNGDGGAAGKFKEPGTCLLRF